MTTTKKYYTGAAIWVIILLLWVSCQRVSAQVKANQGIELDSARLMQQEINKFVDSLKLKTSLKEFEIFLDKNVSQEQNREGTFLQLYQYFIQTKYDIWLREKNKPKPR